MCKNIGEPIDKEAASFLLVEKTPIVWSDLCSYIMGYPEQEEIV